MVTWHVLLAGALVGVGVTMIVAGAVPTHPDLHAALLRLDPRTADDPRWRARSSADGRGWGPGAWVRDRVLPRLVEVLRLRRYAADLHLLDRRPEDLAARKAGYALLGLAFPTLVTLGLAIAGVRLPAVIPTTVALVLAGVLFVLPDVDLRRQVTAAREAMRRAACVFLELVALERAADAGTTEALDRAAAIGGSREFARIRDALLRAELAGQPAWAGLSDLAETTGVPELGDLADIMRLSGQDGAAVYTTLRARAASLRTQLLTATTAKANAASEHMIVPVALLGVAFMALVGYPAFARLLFG
ncbi:type II secretion system F family protein [Cellulomonas fimi]|uniref:Type II secretion system F family protein n=1 Tax=Cellulomonas fimi TaxID=1708 RepID=A0A7Y0LWJ1_CELFI|nr:type II secretion system F family protein [Cellulomonas fimi]NMR19224.1 type II secretion system F family protein [Cellulomonas fimi]